MPILKTPSELRHRHDDHDATHGAHHQLQPQVHDAAQHHAHDADHHHQDEASNYRARPLSRAPKAPLPRGAGQGLQLYFDAQSGLSGDMCVAALLDLGVPFSVVQEALLLVSPLASLSVFAESVSVGALAATRLNVQLPAEQHERSHADVVALLRASKLAPAVREQALRVFQRLADAEGEVHGIAPSDVHFHEVGAADAIFDIVAVAACLEYLGAELSCSALPLGRGHVHCRHGVIPLPAPATVLCLRGLDTYDAGLSEELVTPTGAAIVGALARGSAGWPSGRPLHSGWGAGQRTLPDRPNALRAVLLEPTPQDGPLATHEVLACNVDDMTGEQITHCIERLLGEGALDAWAQPIVMKKGRAAWTLSALATRAASAHIATTLLRESSSLGLRRSPVSRVELAREMREVSTRYGLIPVKVAGDAANGTQHIKPEFEVCRQLALQHGAPLREVMMAAQLAALAVLEAAAVLEKKNS
jgi:uncharacterized protein (TIGR00299 family) protein